MPIAVRVNPQLGSTFDFDLRIAAANAWITFPNRCSRRGTGAQYLDAPKPMTTVEPRPQRQGDEESSADPAFIDRPLWAPLSVPLAVVCIIAALVHLGPFIAADLLTPPGWTFTGNVSMSPDYMPYRIWMRTSQETGLLVRNNFTGEPNRPHLLVLVYWSFGQIARITGLRPETVYELAGCIFAFALTWLIWCAVAHFGRSRLEKLWTLAAIMLGGGLASHAKLLRGGEGLSVTPTTSVTPARALEAVHTLESYRGTYVLSTLLDTHYLIIWTGALLAVLMAYQTFRRPTATRWIATLALFSVVTLIHIYDGFALVAIIAASLFVFWRLGLPVRRPFILLVAGSIAIGAVALWQIWLWRSSGLPLPTWTEIPMLFSAVLAGYPLAFALIAWGGVEFARRSHFGGAYLLAWALGLLALMLSGPFYPYTTRAAITLSIPLYLIAARVYFRDRTSMPLTHGIVAAVVLFAFPVYLANNWARALRFEPTKTHIWVNPNHLEVIDYLKKHASPDDLLVVDRAQPAWKTDDRWLAPEYPGRLYAGHFFLTVDYDAKRRRVIEFYHNSSAEERVAFLRHTHIRWVFAGSENDLAQLRATPGVVVRLSFPEGSLLEYTG